MNMPKFVWASLNRNRVRLVLVFMSLMVAFLLFGLLQPIGLLFAGKATGGEAARLVVMPKYSTSDILPVRYHDDIKRIEGVAVVGHMTWFGGTFRNAESFFPQYAISADALLTAMPEIELAASERAAFLNTRRAAIIGRTTAERHGIKPGDRMPLIPTIWHNRDGNAWEFEVVGIFDSASAAATDDAMYFHYEYFDEYRVIGNGTVSTFVVKGDAGVALGSLAARIDGSTANSGAETKSMSDREYALSFARQMGDVGLIVSAILAAVFFTIVLVTGNSVAQSVRERWSELAVLNVLGFKPPAILGLVLAEVLLLTIGSALAGLWLADILLARVDTWMPALRQLGEVRIGAQVFTQGLGLALGLAVLVAAGPVTRVLRMNIVDTLRISA